MAEVEDQHVLGVLQFPGTLRQLVVAQVLGHEEGKAGITLRPAPTTQSRGPRGIFRGTGCLQPHWALP